MHPSWTSNNDDRHEPSPSRDTSYPHDNVTLLQSSPLKSSPHQSVKNLFCDEPSRQSSFTIHAVVSITSRRDKIVARWNHSWIRFFCYITFLAVIIWPFYQYHYHYGGLQAKSHSYIVPIRHSYKPLGKKLDLDDTDSRLLIPKRNLLTNFSRNFYSQHYPQSVNLFLLNDTLSALSISSKSNKHPLQHFNYPRTKLKGWSIELERETEPLNITTLSEKRFEKGRLVHPEDRQQYENMRHIELEYMNNQQPNLPDKLDYTEELSGRQSCYRPNWSRIHRPICNIFFETPCNSAPFMTHAPNLQSWNVTYLSSGYFRDAFMVVHDSKDYLNETIQVVAKTFRLHEDFRWGIRERYSVHKEAAIIDQLSNSPYILDLLGMCGTSVWMEPAPIEVAPRIMVSGTGYLSARQLQNFQRELDSDAATVRSFNNLTPQQKLNMALVMAKSVATLHGNPGGVIVHGDLHPVQWLQTALQHQQSIDLSHSTSNGDVDFNSEVALNDVKLNDFGSAEILDWDPWNQKYCTVVHHYDGVFRSPEEMRALEANEQLDVYSMGNVFYTLLTGLYPYFELGESSSGVDRGRRRIKRGVTPLIDDRYRHRSAEEDLLIELMTEMWAYNSTERINIFEVVERLQQAKLIMKDEDSS
jgi:hypothetical protein